MENLLKENAVFGITKIDPPKLDFGDPRRTPPMFSRKSTDFEGSGAGLRKPQNEAPEACSGQVPNMSEANFAAYF